MHRGLKIAVLIAGTLLGIWFLLAGSMKFMARPAFDEMFARLGVPLGMVPLTGALEVLGGILVLIPRTAIYGAGLIAVVMVGAVASHLISGSDSPVSALVALAMACFVFGVRYKAQKTQSGLID